MLGSEEYDAIYNRIRYLISLESGITYIFSHYFVKIKVDSYDILPDTRPAMNVKISVFVICVEAIIICCYDYTFDVEIIVTSKLIETKTNSKYLIGIKFDKAIRPLVFIMPKMSGYVKTFKVKEGDKDKSNKLMSFHIDDEKLLEKYKAIWTKIEDLENIELNALPVYDDRYIKT